MNTRLATKIFYWLFWAALLTPLIYWSKLWFPFVTTKTLFFQSIVEAALPFYLFLIVQNKEFRPNLKNSVSLAIFGFFGINIISALSGVNFNQSFWGAFRRMNGVFDLGHLILFYFYILTLAKIDRDFIDRLLKRAVWVSGIAAVYGIWVAVGLPRLFEEPYTGRISSFFGNPIFFASFLILPMFLAVLLAMREDVRRRKYAYWLLAFIHLLGIYVSVTRGALVGLVAGFFAAAAIYAVLARNRRSKLYGSLIVLGLILSAGLVFNLKPRTSSDSIASRFVRINDNDSKARLIQWQIALEGFKDRPVLGTGPENYYIIADKYFRPELYNYDSSWWDKPHNYLLEILTTTGIVGLLSYSMILVFAGKSVLRAYRDNNLSLIELCVLSAAIAAYQVQNLFVFDTISASQMLFMFLGFVSLLGAEKDLSPEKKSIWKPQVSKAAFGAAALGVICLFYVSNWSQARILYNLGKATVREVKDAALIQSYYEKSAELPFNHDLAQVGMDYEGFAVAAVRDTKIDRQFAMESVNDAIRVWEKVVRGNNNAPSYYWLKLANLYYIRDFTLGTGNFAEAEQALSQAEKTAPGRFEYMQTLAKIKIEQSNIPEAEKLVDRMLEIIPQNTNSHWHYKNKDDVLAVVYQLIKYYSEKQDHHALISIQTKAINRIKPNDYLLYANLAESYAQVGNKEQAIEAAKKVMELNPEERTNAEEFIRSLQ